MSSQKSDCIIPSVGDVAKAFLAVDVSREIDPPKLQKLLYFSYAYAAVNAGVEQWDNSNRILIKSPQGPFVRDIHNDYNGYSICSELRPELNAVFVDPIRHEIVTTTYNIFKGIPANELEKRSQMEFPWLRAKYMFESLDISNFIEEYTKPKLVNEFWKALLENASEDALQNFHPHLKKLLNNNPVEYVIDFTTSWSTVISSYAKAMVAKILYPAELRNNFDSKNNLYGRPIVIKKVALACRFLLKDACNDLIQILHLFNVDDDTEWIQLAESRLNTMASSGNCQHPSGFSDYLLAKKCKSIEDAVQLYRQSAQLGYPRASFELGKLIPNERIAYLRAAFDGGMLTASDTLLTEENMSFAEKCNILLKRGELGDPIGYYKLALLYEIEGDVVNAVNYFKLAMPFFGHGEDTYAEDDPLLAYFQDVMLIAFD